MDGRSCHEAVSCFTGKPPAFGGFLFKSYPPLLYRIRGGLSSTDIPARLNLAIPGDIALITSGRLTAASLRGTTKTRGVKRSQPWVQAVDNLGLINNRNYGTGIGLPDEQTDLSNISHTNRTVELLCITSLKRRL